MSKKYIYKRLILKLTPKQLELVDKEVREVNNETGNRIYVIAFQPFSSESEDHLKGQLRVYILNTELGNALTAIIELYKKHEQ